VSKEISIFPIRGLPEVQPGSDLSELIKGALGTSGPALKDTDIVVVKQKVVSKAEGRLVALANVKPRKAALKLAKEQMKDPRLVEVILSESKRVVRAGHGVIITETKHGFVCANSGVDQSNVKKGFVALLPLDPDLSARTIRRGLERSFGKSLAVVITDTFGRPWRLGQTDVAIGCSGISPLFSYAGRMDEFGYELRVTEPAVVDEIAGAAELVMGKLSGIPAAVVRGVGYLKSETGLSSLLMDERRDLFR
jgi:coenzyme F420-0:L-glutamate ligase/coenzyme F420-1:gamma-L-glutamate ligase